jgi:anti-sigma factor ChrR (cupin superfamily)
MEDSSQVSVMIPKHLRYHLEAASHPEAEGWKSNRPGISMRTLFDDGQGYRVVLIRYAPGSSVAEHLHTADEHAYVLEGSVRDNRGEYGPGTYLLNPAGTRHSLRSAGGCLVLIHWLGPVQFLENGEAAPPAPEV